MKFRAVAAVLAVCVASVLGLAAMDSYATVSCPNGSANQTANSYAECNLPKDEAERYDLIDTVTLIINVIVGVVGVIAVAVIVIGAILFVTSTGESAKTTRARNTILYGVVGLVISLLAFAIVNFVLGSIFNSTAGGSGSGDSGSSEQQGSGN